MMINDNYGKMETATTRQALAQYALTSHKRYRTSAGAVPVSGKVKRKRKAQRLARRRNRR